MIYCNIQLINAFNYLHQMRYTAIIWILFLSLSLNAQTGETSGENAFALSLGNASVAMSGVYGMQGNQAAIVHGPESEFILSAERRFLISDLTSVSFAGKKNLSFGTVGLVVENFGFDEFKEQKLGVAFAKKLSNKLSIGGQFDYLNFSIEGFGNKSTFTFEAGLYSIVNEYFHVSAHVFSPGKIGIGENTDLTTVFRTGFKYIPSKKLDIYTELNKPLDENFDIRFGADYQLVDILNIRIGFSTDPALFSFGFGVKIKEGIHLIGGNAFHQSLGNTPGLTIKFDL